MLLGLNIGKNAATPIEDATSDYLKGLDGVYPHADYVAVNISSPNTKNLRALQSDEALDSLLGAVAERREIRGSCVCCTAPEGFAAAVAVHAMFSWDNITPFGGPVVPEV